MNQLFAIFLVLFLCAGCSQAQTECELKVEKRLTSSEDKPIFKMNEPIEYFIEKGFITEWNKEQAISLLTKVQSGEVDIRPFDAFKHDTDAAEFFSPADFADWIVSFTYAHEDCESPGTGSFSRVAPILKRMEIENNVGSPNDFDLLEAIAAEDYQIDMYKLSALSMIWYHIKEMDYERRK